MLSGDDKLFQFSRLYGFDYKCKYISELCAWKYSFVKGSFCYDVIVTDLEVELAVGGWDVIVDRIIADVKSAFKL